MIKRVIFDIDNTLIPWEKEYNNIPKYVLEELQIPYNDNDLKEISKAFDEYEEIYYKYDKEIMREYINKYTNKDYPKEFFYKTIEKWSYCVPEKIEQEIIDTLEYLKPKYELVLLTDWFKDEQENRLKLLNVLKYFSKTYSAEETNRKPFKDAFENAIGNNKPEECIMIGDNFERDIKGALSAGLNAIYYCDIFDTNMEKGYYTISKIQEIKKIL